MTPADIEPMAQETRHVVGLPLSMGGSGDTSILTGLGIYLGMKAAARGGVGLPETWETASLPCRDSGASGRSWRPT